ncbi:DUF4352 domain-containing protein [Halorussus marinus]|uniref:DUF4352 domain-containing protein n=1 Tax=Halorussus marinus TaxID=2505976 RepID=UPI001092A4E2|nr:DUF4352 domain-containing protein [Halorussus marinus]
MNRRDALTGAAATISLVLAGCSGESTPGTTTEDDRGSPASTETEKPLPDVDVTATDTSVGDADTHLRVQWRGRVQRVLEPTGEAATVAEDGHKWLVIQVSVRHVGGTAWETTPVPFVVDVDGQRYEVSTSRAESYFGSSTLEEEDVESGWLAFQIPREATSATMNFDSELISATVSAGFEEDQSLSFDIDQ